MPSQRRQQAPCPGGLSRAHRLPLAIVYVAFRIMAGIGLLMRRWAPTQAAALTRAAVHAPAFLRLVRVDAARSA